MELYPTLDMIEYYFKKVLQGSQFHHYHNIILGIHEDKILSYNEFRIALLEEKKLELDREKEESQKASRISGD